ncbi:acyltransferase family protein [Rhodopseudomonas sp. RCAM05734]|uniref:acyltransferase family protein n=1 Tax=Rhodopseudomonas sp. RCAM05734 TaxID=3457549 RepID=UPI00404395CB
MTELTLTSHSRADIAVASAQSRNAGLDALRSTLTLLVVFHHAAITYGAIGGWFYREVPTDGRFETKLLIFFCTLNQAYFMGLFFLLAGYFTPGSVDKNGPMTFVRERLLRLAVPLIVFGLLIGPATIALAQTSNGQPFLSTLLRLWGRGTFENGPLWFAQALLIFSMGYVAWLGIASRFHSTSLSAITFPSNFAIALAALSVGAAAFALRLVWPVGTQVWGLQVGYFASYVVLFVAGCVGSSGKWLEHVPDNSKWVWSAIAGIAVPILPIVVLSASFFPELKGDTSGGWNVQAVVYSFWEPLVAWGLILVLLSSFHRIFGSLNSVWAALSRRAYTIFIIHPPVLVAIALAWRNVQASHLVKFAVTGTLTSLTCFLIAGVLLRLPLIKRIV